MLGRVIEWMYPTVCPVCQKVLGKGKIICDTCKDELHIINEPRCAKCGKPLTDSGKTYCNDCKKMKHYYDRARSVFEYTGEMKFVLYRFKYGNSRDYGKFFAKVAKDVLENKLKEWNVQAIIPVPMYKDKEIKRGYNQAELLSRRIALILIILLFLIDLMILLLNVLLERSLRFPKKSLAMKCGKLICRKPLAWTGKYAPNIKQYF